MVAIFYAIPVLLEKAVTASLQISFSLQGTLPI